MSAPYRIRRADVQVKVAAAQPAASEGFKEYLDRLMRMIPAEVVGLYLIGSGLIPIGHRLVLLIWTAICLIGVVVIRAFGTTDRQKNLPPQWGAVFISAAAFIIWIYSFGGVFALYDKHIPYIGSLLVLAWTFFVPIFYRGTLD